MSESTITSEFTVHTQPHVACDNESSRYALGGVRVIPGNDEGQVWLTSTDGRIAVALPAKGHTDEPRICPLHVFKTTKSQRHAGLTVVRNGKWQATTRGRSGNTVVTGDDVEGRYPHIEDVLPQVDECIELTLDVDLVQKIRHAINQDNDKGVTLFVPKQNKKDRVETGVAVLGKEGIGVLMPLYGEESNRQQYESLRTDHQSAQRTSHADHKEAA